MKINRIHISTISRKLLSLIIYLTLVSNVYMVAQTTSKTRYSSELDSLWSMDSNIHKISNDGNWTTFSEKFPGEKKVIWVNATTGQNKFKLPNSEYLDFASNSEWFACINNENELITIDLKKLQERRYRDITYYSFSNEGTHIAMLKKVKDRMTELIIMDLQTQQINKILNVLKFEWHPIENKLFAVIEEKDTIRLIQYDNNTGQSKILYAETAGQIDHLYISGEGNSLLFSSKKGDSNQLNYYNIEQNSLNILSDSTVKKHFSNLKISDRKPYLAADGIKVIFYLQVSKDSLNKINIDAQEWNSNDPWIEPRMEFYREQEINYPLTAWFPKNGLITAIETKNLPTTAMDVNHDFALVYDPLQYEPLYKFFPNADLFVKNIKTGDNFLVCKNQYTEGQFITISPEGKNIAYFKDTNWWIYNIASGENINLTKDIAVNFGNNEYQTPGDVFPYGNPGWLPGGEYIILYDQFDVWVFSPDGNYKKRITNGREENVSYRLNRDYTPSIYSPLTIHPDFSCSVFDPTNGIPLELFNNSNYNTGLAVWKDNFIIKPLLWVEGKIDQIRLDSRGEKLVFRMQRFDKPISIHCLDLQNEKGILLHQTNENLLKYELGDLQIVPYELEDGTRLQGSLVYPANFDPHGKYPMVVKIYERESRNINKFFPPSLLMDDGFNLLKFTMNGYFVFYPDISYTIGDPGISALKSVTSAVNKVLEKGRIDKDKIGLIGHSFGGYETAFIITQTNMFAAAVAGSSITDVISYYLEVDWNSKFSQMWRMENQQFRFGDSFYNMKDAYKRNSPLGYVENLNTPLLLWSGKLDTNVNWSQSVQMFLALKRLDKKAKMFLYNQEPHIIIQAQNQIHLTLNILNWMETYVKKEGRTNKPVSRF